MTSYEGKKLQDLMMPSQEDVEEALLKTLFNNNGVIKEFGAGEKLVDDIADVFSLSKEQRVAYLETVYRKENRVKRSYLWHRLLFRAADALAKAKLVSRPTQTVLLTNKREWMLTEDGYNHVLGLLKIPFEEKESLPIKSYEVQKIIKKIYDQEQTEDYNPFTDKNSVKVTREIKLRKRAFGQAVKEAYDYRCAVCGLKIYSPNTLLWEVEAAHIVPHSANGKDDIWNGIALCRLHHWAFDVGWFTLEDDYQVLVSEKMETLPSGYGKVGDYDFLERLSKGKLRILLPKKRNIYPHRNAIKWHRENKFSR